MKKPQHLHITFHNPNPVHQVVDELIKICAELVRTRLAESVERSINTEEKQKGVLT